MPANCWRGDLRDSATENKPPYQGKGETAGKSSPVFGNKKRTANPTGARLNRRHCALALKTVFS